MRVVLVSCTKKKRDKPSPARLLYSPSTYYRKQREYAEAVADVWFIQSAKHGLLHPDEVIEPYDVRADKLDEPDVWARSIAVKLDGEVPPPARVDILGGAAYADPLTPALEKLGYDVHEPLRGLRMGPRLSRLDELCVTEAAA